MATKKELEVKIVELERKLTNLNAEKVKLEKSVDYLNETIHLKDRQIYSEQQNVEREKNYSNDISRRSERLINVYKEKNNLLANTIRNMVQMLQNPEMEDWAI